MMWLIWLNLAWIIGHELDAVRAKEWEFFVQPFTVSEETAFRVFVILHLPVLIWMLWAMPSQLFQVGFSIFMIAHAIVHFVLRNHPLIRFNNGFSALMIYAPIPTSAVHLWMMYTGT